MPNDKSTIPERLAMMRAAGVPLSAADEQRIAASVTGSLKALDQIAAGSMFDTEPLHFERTLKQLAEEGGR